MNRIATALLALSLSACSSPADSSSDPLLAPVATCTEDAIANCPIVDDGAVVEVVAEDGSSAEIAIDPGCLEVVIAGGLGCERF
jgi:hypothetical protein